MAINPTIAKRFQPIWLETIRKIIKKNQEGQGRSHCTKDQYIEFVAFKEVYSRQDGLNWSQPFQYQGIGGRR